MSERRPEPRRRPGPGGRVLPDIVPISASSLDMWRRCPRGVLRTGTCSGCPRATPGSSPDFGNLVHAMLEQIHRRGDRAATPRTSRRCSRSTASSPTVRWPGSSPATRSRCPSPAEHAKHELEVARFHRRPPPMFMATGRLDAVWQHDGLLEVRDYKTGSVVTERIADDPRARLQAWLAAPIAAPAAAAAAGPLRAPRGRRSTTTPSRSSPSRGPRRDRGRAARDRGRDPRRGRGRTRSRASPTRRSAASAGTARSAPRAPRRGSPTWPVLRRRMPDLRVPTERPSTRRPVGCPSDGLGPPHPGPRRRRAGRAARRRPDRGRASRSTCSPTRPARRGRRRRRAGGRCSPTSTRSRSIEIVSWTYPDPGALLARRSASTPRRTVDDDGRRQQPADAREPSSRRASRGASTTSSCSAAPSACTPAGGRAARAEGVARRGPSPTIRRARVVGDARPGSSDYEMAHFAVAPTQVYPLFETALRAESGPWRRRAPARASRALGAVRRGRGTQPARVVARPRTPPRRSGRSSRRQPDGRASRTRSACAPTSTSTRPRRCCCAPTRRRRSAGVPPTTGWCSRTRAPTRTTTTSSPSAPRSPTSPAIGVAGAAALEAAGLDRRRRRALRPLLVLPGRGARSRCARSGSPVPTAATTARSRVTGGLGFAGGPGNNYPTHAIAAMVDACRSDPGSVGARHRARVVRRRSTRSASTRPPRRRPASPRSTRRSTQTPGRRRAPPRSRPVPSTARPSSRRRRSSFERDGTPNLGILTALTADGRRALANSRDADTMQSMCAEPWEGRTVTLRNADGANVLV